MQCNTYIKKIIFLIALCIGLSACGFHLRGAYHLPPGLQNVWVQYDKQPFDPLVTKIKQSLKESGVTLASDETQASYIFRIANINENSVLQSTSTTTQVSTYVLNYTLSFSVTDAAGKDILPVQSVTSSNTYIINSAEALNNMTEQPQLLFGLQQDVIFQMMNRLSSNNIKRAFL